MGQNMLDSFKAHKTLDVDGKSYHYFSLPDAAENGVGNIDTLPLSLKVLLENLLRHEDGSVVVAKDVKAVGEWLKTQSSTHEIAYHPARVLMQDFTGVPGVVDLAAMRQAMQDLGGDPKKINPLSPVDLVIDHSVMVDHFGSPDAFRSNVDLEFERNAERYEFLKWAQNSFDNFRVVPPGTGICHQVNLEYLAKVIWHREIDGETWAYPDTLVGTDSHTTMINGLAVLGWGVGGIEAEAAMLSQPVSMLIPEVIGCKLSGVLKEGVTATDLVLTVVERLRQKGVVGKFVEFFGNGLDTLDLANRATIANMAPEYGATCGFFPIDDEAIRYLKFTGRDDHQVNLVEAYAKAQGMWRNPAIEPVYTDVVEIELEKIEPSISGPKRPQDRIALSEADNKFRQLLNDVYSFDQAEADREAPVEGEDYTLQHGHVAIAAITSCTNTSNPSVLLGAGLLAKKAVEKGLKVKPWVKTSLAPGSQVVTDYLEKAGLQDFLDRLGFNLVGYGCTTCIGNSGGLESHVSKAVNEHDMVVCSVLSGNRNFEGRIGQDLRANYLASPPLVVAYALAGSLHVNLTSDSLGEDHNGDPVYLKDIWPSDSEIKDALEASLTPEMFKERYADVFLGPQQWQDTKAGDGFTFDWNPDSTYVRHPTFFESMEQEAAGQDDIIEARPLAILGDSVTTDHISPAGAIKKDSPAGKYLTDHDVEQKDFNSYGSRRGNHEVMMRGTFANIRIKNEMVPGVEGGYTVYIPTGEQMSIYDASMRYQAEGTPLVVVGGKEYGTGSSRDWAAKGTNLLGVRAVIVESFERIHRSNLIGMGVLPLQFTGKDTRKSLKLTGKETFDIKGVSSLKPRQKVDCKITYENGKTKSVKLLCRLDTADELSYFNNGGILHYVLRKLND
ncbi:aconitate hydratase AcnA [Pseudobacteriovorax antillogorgiicola]|uniref:Aconitate hydratase n=1 Tax=Pseudobacteriovorax antillogorgiicola TaxID=1513793 RepID=A0A1Y6CQ02_9BACT|nr:aconitate hydratase AcnA [Pseudobacteriovorax antillogorgiicola]TCS42235.1 aconitase [Pseudobacteriovorax antillogorgiicola]SMF82539.1 aconitase [Pseudobacteriovorax antillogorgiicola]